MGLISEESMFRRALGPVTITLQKSGFGLPPRIIGVEPQTEFARNQILDTQSWKDWIGYLQNDLIVGCKQLELSLSEKHVQRAVDALTAGPITVGQFSLMMTDCGQRIIDELEDKISLQIDARHSQFFGNEKAFGDAVFNAFPSANDDIAEASTCLALDRGTACVMHLSRVVEVGLRAIADRLSLPQRNDWGKHLEDIEKELTKKYRVSSSRSPEEQFLSEAAIQIGHIKVAWRNPSMHIDRSYSLERAEQVFVAIRAFMQHLASELHEPTL